jgi:hypothetical protein
MSGNFAATTLVTGAVTTQCMDEGMQGAMLVAGRLILLVDNVCRAARPGPMNHQTPAAFLSASRSWGAPRQCDPPTRALYWDIN